MISSLKLTVMIPLGLLILMTGCRTTGQFQPNPNGVMEITVEQKVKIPKGGVSYFDASGVELRNDREFTLPYKWRITGPAK